MKRKPDVMVTLVVVFCLGLVISGFTTFGYNQERDNAPLVSSITGDAQEAN
ncbi:hypothetical protein [Hahella ganghwensis]|uniref:hypothetical protein n=1 Tax=Hahella ganghwensis TaxID=286420 RepID=UPI0003621F7D|nr:hypothetical protein [Hahella ganghwensis]